MALLFFCLASLFFLPCCLSSSCPSIPESQVPCNKSIEIKPPFIFVENTTNLCEQAISIRCGRLDNLPNVYLFHVSSPNFYLENIIYKPDNYFQNQLIVRDSVLEDSLNSSGCGNLLFSFLTPSYEVFDYGQFISFTASVKNFCRTPNQSFQSPILGREYTLNYSASTEKNLPAKCNRKPQNGSFEWKFSFNSDGSVVLLSAQYSHSLLSDPECIGKSIVEGGYTNDSSTNYGPPNGKTRRARNKNILIVSTVAVTLIIVIVFLFTIVKIRRYGSYKENKAQENIEGIIKQHGSFAPRRYRYAELKKITNSLNDELGKGGIGRVFKGSLRNGCPVAVKILHDSSQSGEEFVNEVVSIGRTSHTNIVALLGFCIDKSNHAVIYEYMPNGSLDKYIYSENPKANLGWESLHIIAVGVAQGLEYLHRGCSTHIVHFDIKPQNILLDEDFCPKIADFGLAKLCPPKESIVSLAEMWGTIGYIAPEVFSRSFGVVLTKSDVYCYGIMLLEMVGGRRNSKPCIENSSQEYFPHWLHNRPIEGTEIEWCEVTTETENIARKMALIGLWCTQANPVNQPSMGRVLEMFERSLDELELPPKPLLASPPHDIMASISSSSLT